MLVLTSLLRNWKLAVGGIICLAFLLGYMYISHLQARIKAVQAENAVYAQTVVALKADYQAARKRADAVSKIKREVSNAQDGPVAPALAAALDGLRGASGQSSR